jgi:hypothetical protein
MWKWVALPTFQRNVLPPSSTLTKKAVRFRYRRTTEKSAVDNVGLSEGAKSWRPEQADRRTHILTKKAIRPCSIQDSKFNEENISLKQ